MSTAAKRRRKGKRVALPRITLLAYGKRDLVEFTTAVESLRHLVFDLKTQVDQLKAELGRTGRKKGQSAATGKTVRCPKCKATSWGDKGKCPSCGSPLPTSSTAADAAETKDTAE